MLLPAHHVVAYGHFKGTAAWLCCAVLPAPGQSYRLPGPPYSRPVCTSESLQPIATQFRRTVGPRSAERHAATPARAADPAPRHHRLGIKPGTGTLRATSMGCLTCRRRRPPVRRLLAGEARRESAAEGGGEKVLSKRGRKRFLSPHTRTRLVESRRRPNSQAAPDP